MLYPKETSSETQSGSSDEEFEELAPIDKNPISKHVLRLQLHISGITFGLFFAAMLFLATAWLLIKGGENVGTHLTLLHYYCPGYSITWLGSFIGMLYGLFYGYLFGFAIAYVYNKVANFRLNK